MINFLEIRHFKMTDDAEIRIVLSAKKKKENSKVYALKRCAHCLLDVV